MANTWYGLNEIAPVLQEAVSRAEVASEASLAVPSWNQLFEWFQELDILRTGYAA